jgi:hypothetical protein
MGIKLALTLLGGGKDNNYDIGKHLERVAALANPSTELTYAFLPYAKSYVFAHTRELLDCDAELDSMFYKTFNGYLPFVPKPWPTQTVKRWVVMLLLGQSTTIISGLSIESFGQTHPDKTIIALAMQGSLGTFVKEYLATFSGSASQVRGWWCSSSFFKKYIWSLMT